MSKAKPLPDPLRHPQRYARLVQALDHAAQQLRKIEQADLGDFRSMLARFLPDIATALDAEYAFAARYRRSDTLRSWLELIDVHPNHALAGAELELAGPLRSLLDHGRPRVIESLGDSTPQPILELAPIRATSAVLARMGIGDEQYIVGVCNRRDPTIGPFIAADRMTLDYIIESIAGAVRAGEQRKRELESIQRVSEQVVLGALGDVAAQIVTEVIAVAKATAVAIWAINKNQATLEYVHARHATNAQWRPQASSLPLDRSNLNGLVALDQSAHYQPNLQASAADSCWDPTTKSAYCVPLVFRNLVLGTLYVASPIQDGISQDERRFISQLAPHAAIALHNARLQDVQQRVIAFQQTTVDILPLAEELEQVYQQLQKHVNVSGLFIALLQPQSNRLIFPLVYDHGRRIAEYEKVSGHYRPQRLGRRRGLVEWVLGRQKTLLVRDFATDSRADEVERTLRPDVVSCLVTPLISKNRAIGAIALRSYDSAVRFDDYDQRFLEALAHHLAVVIENSHGFDATQSRLRESNEQLRQRVRELEAVSKFQEQISDLATTEGEEIASIYAKATEALQAVEIDTQHLLVVLYRSETNQVEFPVVYEFGRLLTAAEKAADPAYRSRPLGERQDIIDWVLTRRREVLGRSRLEIEQWVETLEGVHVAPQRSHSWLGAPMLAAGELIGMIALRSFQQAGVFAERHRDLLRTIASQAAIAISNARLFEDKEHQVRELDAIYAAGKAIAAAGLELERVLQTILEQAVKITDAHFGTLQLVEGDFLRFEAAWPLSEREGLRARYGLMPIQGPGITARCARDNHYQLVPDVSLNPEYAAGSPLTKSELAVALRKGGVREGRCEGVLNVEHREVGGLTEAHSRSLRLFANLAVVALENARNAEELSRSNAIAIMGAWGAEHQHDINHEVAGIRRTVQILRDRSDLPPEVYPRLAQIDLHAEEMAMPELPEQPPQPGKAVELRSAPLLDAVLQAELATFQRKQPRFQLTTQFNCAEARVAIHEAWLRRILRHFLSNAVKCIPAEHPTPRVALATHLHNGHAEIHIEDNGKGVRADIRHLLFRQPIPHVDQRIPDRPGRGLLLVGYVVGLYGGSCQLAWSEEGEGSRFVIRLPLTGDSIL